MKLVSILSTGGMSPAALLQIRISHDFANTGELGVPWLIAVVGKSTWNIFCLDLTMIDLISPLNS